MTEEGTSPTKVAALDIDESQRSGKKQCHLVHCRYPREGESKLCLFHISAAEKDEWKLWKRCMEKFYDIVGKGGKTFTDFILKDVDLSKRTFDAVMDFSRVRFLGTTDFSFTQFKDVATFKGAAFSGDVTFQEAIFRKEAVFTESTFEGDANYRDVRFDAKTYFKRIRFRTANFHSSIFGDKSIFSPKKEGLGNALPTFELADFSGVHFEKGGSFDHCIIPHGNFEDSSIQNLSFREVNLDEVRFAGAQMEFAYLSDSEWTVDLDRPQYRSLMDWFSVYDPRLVIREELDARDLDNTRADEKIKAYKKAESTYRRIKHSLANEGHYEKAGEFYIHEMRMKKERYSLNTGLIAKWNHFWNVLYSWTCGYGERPKRVFVNAFIIIILFTLLYASFDGIQKTNDLHAEEGAEDGEDNVGDKDGNGEDYDPSFRECLYFSVVTFTTLGYGDYSPKSGFQLIAVIEAFLGAFTIALFVLVFGRKVMR